MRLTGPDVEAFLERLKDEDRDPFRKRYEDNLDDLDDEEVESIISTDINESQLHTGLVKAVASGFSVKTDSLGDNSKFTFHSTDPLCRRKPSEADALLVRSEDRRVHFAVVICEVGERSVHTWTKNVDSAYDVFESSNSASAIKKSMGMEDKDTGDVQYILLAPKSDLNSIPLSKLANNVQPDRFAIWSGKIEDPSELCHERGNNIHKDLKDIGTGCFDWASEAENPIKYTAGTHPLIPLKQVTFEIIREKKIFEKDDHPLEFNKDEFRDEYESHLQVKSKEAIIEKIVRQQASEMFELAEQIGIYSSLKSDRKTVRDYRVMFPGNTDDPLEAKKCVEEKYREVAVEKKKEELAFEDAKEGFETRQSGLEDWESSEED